MEEISLYGPNGKPDWFWKLNPKGQVPVLVVGEKEELVLADSDLVLDRMDEVISTSRNVASSTDTSDNRIVLQDPEHQQRIQTFRTTLKDFLPIGKRAVLGGRTNDKNQMWNKLKELDSLIVGPYVCGEQVTIADCAGFPFLWRLETEFGPFHDHGCGNMGQWLETCKANDAFSGTIQQSWWWWW